jgi:hypothetical protein
VIIFNVLSNCICVAFHSGKFVTKLQSATFIFTVHEAVSMKSRPIRYN